MFYFIHKNVIIYLCRISLMVKQMHGKHQPQVQFLYSAPESILKPIIRAFYLGYYLLPGVGVISLCGDIL